MMPVVWKDRIAGTLLASLIAVGASAQDVQLFSTDGLVDITGRFIDYDGSAYIIETEIGQVRVLASEVDCRGNACPDLADFPDIMISGSAGNSQPLMPLLLEGYAASTDGAVESRSSSESDDLIISVIANQGYSEQKLDFAIRRTSTTSGLSALLSDEVDIVIASRPMAPDELQDFADRGAGDMAAPEQQHLIATENVIVVVHPENTISQLDQAQLASIYRGEVTNWAELGGDDLTIVPVLRNESDDRIDAYIQEVSAIERTQIASGSEAVADIVAQTPGAVGVIGQFFQRGARRVPVIDACGVAMRPSAFSAKAGEYPMQRQIFLYTRGDNSKQGVDELTAWATSSRADGVIVKAGYLGFGVARVGQTADGQRAQSLQNETSSDVVAYRDELLDLMTSFDRLSTTFRFPPGQTTLDAGSLVQQGRLRDYLEEQPPGSELLFVGFTDDQGDFASNLSLSERRAALVAESFAEFAGDTLAEVSIASLGFGEIAPTACNLTEAGRDTNRRVEVWIRSPT